MQKWLRRARAAIGMGLTWAVGWLGVGVAFGLLAFSFEPAALAINALASAAAGFVGGALFSVVLGIADGRRRFDQLSLLRFACWGVLGGLLVGGAQLAIFAAMGRPPDPFVFLTLQGLIGASSAAGTLALARRVDDRELLESSEQVSEIGLTQDEKRLLLGDNAD
jgi:hypothetical protein